ncbi:DDE-type integrase/transposase/recombinase [Pseudomonas putida]|uniref:DDE-type integrase/transposase/recombinase n=1 Tax=Pseudomonas putida TaxID=303 RepID=UPI0009BB88C4|nr:DDE-type integrase/transposase/recombinase [Pseudomonas putida]
MRTLIIASHEFSPIVGEHYSYYGHTYEIMEIVADRHQLRSLERCGTVTYHRFDRLQKAWKKGRFICLQEAPLDGEPNKILAGLTQIERDAFSRRLSYVEKVLAKLNGPHPIREVNTIIASTARTINDPTPPCYNTVHNWIKAYFRSNQNPISLVTRSIRRKTPRLLHQPFVIQEIVQHHINEYLLIKTPFSVTDIIEQIQAAIEITNTRRPVNDLLPPPSTSTLRRILNEHDDYERTQKQRGKKEAGKRHYWGIKNQHDIDMLESAECDSHKFDIELVDEDGAPCGRPWLTCLINVASRRVIGWKISMNHPTLETTLSALKYSLGANNPRTGLCRTYVIDNGAEFIKDVFKILLASMGSTPIFCEPAEPNQKPHIERFFKTLEVQLIHYMRGTTFSNPKQKGDYNSKAEACYTLDQLEHAFQDWLENVYHQSYHREIGTSPNLYWDNHKNDLFPPRQFSEIALKQMFLCKESAFAVNGRIGFKKLQWTCPSVPFLNRWRGQRKKLTIYYDICDLGKAYVCHPDNPDELHSVQAVNPEYQEGLCLSTHLQILEKTKEDKETFNHSIAIKHRVRINQSIVEKNKQKSHSSKSATNQGSRLGKRGENSNQDNLFEPTHWVDFEVLPNLTAACPGPSLPKPKEK